MNDYEEVVFVILCLVLNIFILFGYFLTVHFRLSINEPDLEEAPRNENTTFCSFLRRNRQT